MKNRGSNRGDGKLKKKKCPYFRSQTVCVCALVCACARVCVAGRATLNRTCVVCGRIHFSLVPETNPVHTNKDDVIYQRFPAVLLISSSSAAAARTVVDACTPPTHRCTITTPRHSYTLNTVIQYLYVCMYVCLCTRHACLSKCVRCPQRSYITCPAASERKGSSERELTTTAPPWDFLLGKHYD